MSEDKVLALVPEGMPDYLIPAWFSAIRAGLREPAVLGSYRAQTGDTWEPALDVLSQQIDQVTGREWAFFEGFINWYNENLWGTDWTEEDAEA